MPDIQVYRFPEFWYCACNRPSSNFFLSKLPFFLSKISLVHQWRLGNVLTARYIRYILRILLQTAGPGKQAGNTEPATFVNGDTSVEQSVLLHSGF